MKRRVHKMDKAAERRFSGWLKQYHDDEIVHQAEVLPLRRDMVTLLTYVRDTKVVGTQSTGNMPLKAVREVTARFVNPPELETVIGDHLYKIRSEAELWPLYFLHILAEVGGLLKRAPTEIRGQVIYFLTFVVIMPRFARIVVPGYPYHVTHCGNRREDVFFDEEDRETYQKWLREYADKYGLEIWAYCLMTNHIHLLACPRKEDALANAIGRAHMRFARYVNRKQEWSGHLWANRYYSTVLDEGHLWTAVRYVESNPVRAEIVDRAEDYAWSSARAHCGGEADALLSPNHPFPGHIKKWGMWLSEGIDEEELDLLRRNTYTGRPTGSAGFIEMLEKLLGRKLKHQKPGRKRRNT